MSTKATTQSSQEERFAKRRRRSQRYNPLMEPMMLPEGFVETVHRILGSYVNELRSAISWLDEKLELPLVSLGIDVRLDREYGKKGAPDVDDARVTITFHDGKNGPNCQRYTWTFADGPETRDHVGERRARGRKDEGGAMKDEGGRMKDDEEGRKGEVGGRKEETGEQALSGVEGGSGTEPAAEVGGESEVGGRGDCGIEDAGGPEGERAVVKSVCGEESADDGRGARLPRIWIWVALILLFGLAVFVRSARGGVTDVRVPVQRTRDVDRDAGPGNLRRALMPNEFGCGCLRWKAWLDFESCSVRRFEVQFLREVLVSGAGLVV